MIQFLFPSDPVNPRVPDEAFDELRLAVLAAGFSASLVADAVWQEGSSLRGIPAGASVVYRGWMLRPDEYSRLTAAIEAAGATPFTSPEQYVAAHYLPNWYPLIPDLTPQTRVFSAEDDLVRELRRLGWEGYFVKDYVKSLKTSRGAIIREPEEIVGLLAEMEKFRGEIEGGVCVRRVEDLLSGTEIRYFVLQGRAVAAGATDEIPAIVSQCAERIASPFFSVDVARRSDGVLRVVEVGDGQVSDPVGWSADAFAAMWRSVA